MNFSNYHRGHSKSLLASFIRVLSQKKNTQESFVHDANYYANISLFCLNTLNQS